MNNESLEAASARMAALIGRQITNHRIDTKDFGIDSADRRTPLIAFARQQCFTLKAVPNLLGVMTIPSRHG